MIWPQKLQGVSSLQAWLNRLLYACRSSEVVNSEDIYVERAANGTKLKIRKRPVGGGGAQDPVWL